MGSWMYMGIFVLSCFGGVDVDEEVDSSAAVVVVDFSPFEIEAFEFIG